MTRTATRSETLTVAKRIVKEYDLSPIGEYDDVKVIARKGWDGGTGFVIVSDYLDMVQVSGHLRGSFKPGLWTEPINGCQLAVYVETHS